jgi:hypothetical protein
MMNQKQWIDWMERTDIGVFGLFMRLVIFVTFMMAGVATVLLIGGGSVALVMSIAHRMGVL